MKYLLIALSVAVACSGCLQSVTAVSSGKIAIPALMKDKNGDIVPLGVQANVSYVGTFYNYQSPVVAMSQYVFAEGDGGLMIYGTGFSNDSATTVIFKNTVTAQEISLPATQFTISSGEMQMRAGYTFPVSLPGGPGQFQIIVKNANSEASSPYPITVVGPRPQLEYRVVMGEDSAHHLTSYPPVVNSQPTNEVVLSSNNIYGTGIIPTTVYVEVKNPSLVSIEILHTNFFEPDGNTFYTWANSSNLEVSDTTPLFVGNFWGIVTSYGWSINTTFCQDNIALGPGQKCYIALSLNTSLPTGKLHDSPTCYNYVWTHGIEFEESTSLGLPHGIQKLDVREKAYNTEPQSCQVIGPQGGGGNTN